jgi:UDP-N-acetylmuramoylalanine--D-glutamate ligase
MIASRIHHRLRRVHAKDIKDQSRWPSLQGPHNAQNVACAIAACEALGAGRRNDRARACHLSRPCAPDGTIGEVDGVLYVNDSKATNPTSTAPALGDAYPAIHWLLRRSGKTDDLDACLPHLGNVRAAYAFGEDGGTGGDPARQGGGDEYPTLRDAALAAAGAASAGDSVLLSPACASLTNFAISNTGATVSGRSWLHCATGGRDVGILKGNGTACRRDLAASAIFRTGWGG